MNDPAHTALLLKIHNLNFDSRIENGGLAEKISSF